MILKINPVRGINHFYWKPGITFLYQDMDRVLVHISNLYENGENLGLKGNTNVSISPEFELWTRATDRVYEKIVITIGIFISGVSI